VYRHAILPFALVFAFLLPPASAAAQTMSRHVGITTTDTTLTVAEPSAPDTLDPLLTRATAGVDAAAPVFDSLVRLDATGAFTSDLATHWRRSVDARTWTFDLNPRARWHDGVPVTAADVAFTIGLVRDARFGAASTLGFDAIATVAVAGTHALTITLRAAYAPFLATVGTTPILPRHVLGAIAPAKLRAYTPFNRHPIGSGPYTVDQVTADGRVVEDANQDYFGGVPAVTHLIFAPLGSRAAALAAARRDSTLLLPSSLGLTPRDVSGAGIASSDAVAYTPSFAWTHIDLIEHGALSDPVVRRALALATPRGQIVAQVLRGHGHISDGDQAPGTAAYDPALHYSYRYDPHAAHALLRQAGYKRLKSGLMGRGTTPLTITLWADTACSDCAATLGLVARGWRAAGVATTVRLVPTASLFGTSGLLYDPTRFTKDGYDAVLYSWINGPDPDDSAYWTHAAFVTPTHPLGGNFSGYDNPQLDKLTTDAIVTPNGPGRDALYRRIQRILVTDEPDVFLYWADSVSIVPRRLHGYNPTPYNSAATWNAGQWSL
jgi:peptide/nickel transport system substrate-binding protein